MRGKARNGPSGPLVGSETEQELLKPGVLRADGSSSCSAKASNAEEFQPETRKSRARRPARAPQGSMYCTFAHHQQKKKF